MTSSIYGGLVPSPVDGPATEGVLENEVKQ